MKALLHPLATASSGSLAIESDLPQSSSLVRQLATALFLLALMVYGLTAAGHIQTIDVEEELQVAQTLLSSGSVAIAHDGSDVIGARGQPVSGHGIGESILLLPAALTGQLVHGSRSHLLARFVASLLNPAAAAATVAMLFLFAVDLGMRARTAAICAALFAFASIEWPYAHDAFDVTPTGLFLLMGLFGLHRYVRRKRVAWLLLAGGAVGFSLLLRVPSVVCLPILGAYLAISIRRLGWTPRLRAAAAWLAPVLLAFVVMGWYNWARFASPLIFSSAPARFTTPIQVGLSGLLLSPGKGLLFFCPIILLGIWGLRFFLHEHQAIAWTIVAIGVANLAFYAKFEFWSGEWAWGPRYLVPVVPLILLPAVFVLERWRSLPKLVKSLVVGIILASTSVQAIGVTVDYEIQSELMLQAGTLQLEHWQPRYSQIVVHAIALRDIVEGSALYPTARRSHDAVAGRPPVTTIDFWWVYALLNGFSRQVIILVVGSLGLFAVAILFWLRRLNRRLSQQAYDTGLVWASAS